MLDWNERGHVLATCDPQVVYCRIIGVGNMNNCAPFQSFATRMRERGYRHFILDFSACEGLDSTFLGILVGLSLGEPNSQTRVVVVNTPSSVARLLAEVGIDQLLEMCREPVRLPEIPMSRLESVPAAPDRKIGMVLAAHEDLCRIHGENTRRFGTFLDLLRAEMSARHGSHAAAGTRIDGE